ncbi:MAG TPA: hypothetical protein PKY96_08135, partial [Flavobacteriales bacterium]|nr:hypothetical protein [Flavobacteriales bacterium]
MHIGEEALGIVQAAERGAGDDGIGALDAGAVQRFHVERPRDLSFELLLDGTGAAGGEKKEVEKELEKLYKAVGFNGKIHRPNKLIVVWGKFLFQGVVKSVDVTYT